MTTKEFELTDAQHAAIIEACRPLPYIVAGGIAPESLQERANRAWRSLGDELGFEYMTVRPSPKGERFFSAEVKQP